MFTDNQKEKLIQAFEDNPKLTIDASRDKKINKPRATDRTIRNILNEKGLKARVSISLSFPEDTPMKRLKFALEYNKKPEIWNQIIFFR